jgi:hypothetical protein
MAKRNPDLTVRQDVVKEPSANSPPSLEQIRSNSLRARTDAVRTITELEEWRDEIDATIAFLRAQLRSK